MWIHDDVMPKYRFGPQASRRARAMLLSAVSIFLLGGCANKAIFNTGQEGPEFLPKVQTSAAPSTMDGGIYVIRWPAVVLPAAKPTLVDNNVNWVRRVVGYADFPGFPAFAEYTELSSTYFAAELYWALRRAHPQSTVLLEPQAVEVTGFGEARQRPLADPAVSPDLVLDLWTLTAADAPLLAFFFNFSIQTAPSRSPGNCGLLVSTVTHQPTESAFKQLDCVGGGEPRNALQSSFYLDGDVRPDGIPGRRSKLGLPLSQDETSLFRVLSYSDGHIAGATMSDYVKSSRPQKLADADQAPLLLQMENYARVAVSALPVVNARDLHPKIMSNYVRVFDAPIAEALDAGRALTATQRQNMALIQRIHAQEVVIRARRDEAIAREVFAGRFGGKFRQARDDAYGAQTKRMLGMWASTVASLGMYNSQLQQGGGGLNTLQAQNMTMDYFNAQQEQLGKQFVASVAPSLTSASKASIKVLEEGIDVSVNDQAALRAALMGLYKKHKR